MSGFNGVGCLILAAMGFVGAVIYFFRLDDRRRGVHVVDTPMKPGFVPPSASMNPAARVGPLPGAGEIDPDYAVRVVAHAPCDWGTCPHTFWSVPHCRSGDPWPCELAGLLNEPRIAGRRTFKHRSSDWGM